MSSTQPGAQRGLGLVRNIQALRAVAALLVVLVHISLPTVGLDNIFANDPPWFAMFTKCGLAGVDLFFVISGFIMLTTSWSSFGQTGSGLRFFVRRVIRIYPPYWFALVPVLPAFFFAKNELMKGHIGAQTGIVQSLLLLPQPTHMLLAVSWSLVWEMIFYTIFAFLLIMNRRQLPLALAVWFLAEVALHLTFRDSQNFAANFASTPLPIEFIFGVVVGLVYVNRRFWAPGPLGALGIVAMLAVWTLMTANVVDENTFPFGRVLLFGVPAFLIVYGAVGLETVHRIVAPSWLVSIGDASYAIYLWHLGVLVVLRHMIAPLHFSGFLWHLALVSLALGDILLVSFAVYWLFEKPATSYLNAQLASHWPARRPSSPSFIRPMIAPEAVAD
ncbi:MAG: acyltransferase family protein [Vulcanimicrobiaceae bacterium]